MADSGMSMPSGMGGLMRFNEEYPSKLRISPEIVVVLIVIVIIGMTILKLTF
jgi:preprotein translocase subunit Sec61beta